MGRFIEETAHFIDISQKLGHVVILNLVMVTTSPVSETQATGCSSQVTVPSPMFLLWKLRAATQSKFKKFRVNAHPIMDS